jgi:gas vesicle protein
MSAKFLTGALAGIAAGALLGVLFAPAKGSVIRKKVFRMKQDYTDSLKEEVDEFIDGLAEKFDLVKKESTDLKDKGKRKLEDLKHIIN